MTVELTIIIAIIGCIISVVSFFNSSKKTNNVEIETRARFEGSISVKLDNVIKAVAKLDEKMSKNTSELYAEIENQIKNHEERYHK